MGRQKILEGRGVRVSKEEEARSPGASGFEGNDLLRRELSGPARDREVGPGEETAGIQREVSARSFTEQTDCGHRLQSRRGVGTVEARGPGTESGPTTHQLRALRTWLPPSSSPRNCEDPSAGGAPSRAGRPFVLKPLPLPVTSQTATKRQGHDSPRGPCPAEKAVTVRPRAVENKIHVKTQKAKTKLPSPFLSIFLGAASIHPLGCFQKD